MVYFSFQDFQLVRLVLEIEIEIKVFNNARVQRVFQTHNSSDMQRGGDKSLQPLTLILLLNVTVVPEDQLIARQTQVL